MSAFDNKMGEFCQLTARLGRNENLVQAAGGNASIKDNGVLWVKASGSWMAQADKEDIFVPLDLAGVKGSFLSDDGGDVTDHILHDSPLRPSIETSLHALMEQCVVLHVHSVNILSFAVCVGGRDALSELLNDFNWEWVPYCRPGIDLSRRVGDVIKNSPDVLVLENHGLVVGAENCDAANALLAKVEAAVAPSLVRTSSEPDYAFLESVVKEQSGNLLMPKHALVHSLATDSESLRMAQGGVLYPDHVVFLGPEIAVWKDDDDYSQNILRHEQSCGVKPLYFVFQGRGVLVVKGITAGAEEMLLALALVLQRVDPDEILNYLDKNEVYGLLNWDAEKYRQSLDV